MAELNFGLLNPPGSQSIGNAFVSGMDQAAAARAQENQNALAQYTLSKAKREDQVKNQLLAELRAATTPEQQQQAYINAGMGKEAVEMKGIGLKNLQTQAETEYKRAQTGAIPGQIERDKAATGASNAARQRDRQKFINQATRDLALNPSDDNIRAYGQDAVLKELYTQEEADKITAAQLAIPMDQRAAQFRQAGAAAAAPQVTPAEINTMTQLGIPRTPEGYAAFRASQQPRKLLTDDEFEQQLRLRQEGRPPVQPRAEQPLEKVVDPVTGKPVLVSREEAVRGRMTPAASMEGLAPKEIQKREAAYPQATGSINQLEKNSDDLIAKLKALRDSPGLPGITGFVAGRTPNLTGAARSAQADLKTILAEGTLGTLTALRNLSKTGGALGNSSDKDVALLTNAFGAFDQTQNTADFRTKINNAIDTAESAKRNARETYDMTYSYRSDGAAPPPRGAPPAKPAAALSLQEQAAAELARRASEPR